MGLLYRSEHCLAFFYTLGGVSALVTTICTAIVWLHWRVVLNTCAGNFQSYTSYYDEKDCGCFLYARDTLTYFVGSHVGWCYWATFGLLIPTFFCFCYGCYHVYRVCCKTVKPQHAKMRARARSTEVMELTIEQEEPRYEDNISPYYWTPAAIISFLMLAYSLVHAILLTDGFFSTCKQYRNRIVKISQATGPMVGVLQSRISCAAVFDFMDYLQEDLSFERRRDYRINTSIPFVLAIIGSWLALFSWIAIFTINCIRYSKSGRLRV